MKKQFITYIFFITILGLLLPSCDTLFTVAPDETETLDGPMGGLSSAQIQAFLAGDEAFGETFTAETGLGPIFNQNSCATCHIGDGRGHPDTAFTRIGVIDSDDASVFDYLPSLGGSQIQDNAILGYQAETVPTSIEGMAQSVRMAPPVVGLGFIEYVTEVTILENVDPDDLDGDGISGRANFVSIDSDLLSAITANQPTYTRTPNANGKILARFGQKATSINLLHQTVNAYLNDMGITSDFLVDDLYNPKVGGPSGDLVPDPEVSASTVHSVVFYLQTLKAPTQRTPDDPTVKQGKELFTQINCSACHIPEMVTGESPIAQLSVQRFSAYTDLLLHDMGEDLADNLPEGDASGTEWKTPALWGLGLADISQGGTAFYLHDGRTSDLEEAITLHGGEAKTSKDAYVALSESEKAAVLEFLLSL